jgi:hypothetical protein
LHDVLEQPLACLIDVKSLSGVGDLTISRFRRALVEAFMDAAPREWAFASTVGSRSSDDHSAAPVDTDMEIARQLIRFRKVWKVDHETFPAPGHFHRRYDHAQNSTLSDAIVEARPFIYAPETVPEVLKTPEVMWVEKGYSEQKQDYLHRLGEIRHESQRLPAGSIVLLDVYKLDDLAGCRGRYAALTPEAASEQIIALADFLLIDPLIHVLVTDFQKHGLSSGFATRKGPLLHYCFDGYLEIQSPEMVSEFWRIAQDAATHSMPFSAWIGRLTGTSARDRTADQPAAADRRAEVVRLLKRSGAQLEFHR